MKQRGPQKHIKVRQQRGFKYLPAEHLTWDLAMKTSGTLRNRAGGWLWFEYGLFPSKLRLEADPQCKTLESGGAFKRWMLFKGSDIENGSVVSRPCCYRWAWNLPLLSHTCISSAGACLACFLPPGYEAAWGPCQVWLPQLKLLSLQNSAKIKLFFFFNNLVSGIVTTTENGQRQWANFGGRAAEKMQTVNFA